MSACITPTLFLGPEEDRIWLTNVIPVKTVEGAVAVIKDGNSALLPDGCWAEAEEVLRRLGLDEDGIADRIHFAQTGRFL